MIAMIKHPKWNPIQNPNPNSFAYQSEGTQGADTRQVCTFKRNLKHGQRDNDKVEYVPANLKVIFGAHGNKLHTRFHRENRRENLHKKVRNQEIN